MQTDGFSFFSSLLEKMQRKKMGYFLRYWNISKLIVCCVFGSPKYINGFEKHGADGSSH